MTLIEKTMLGIVVLCFITFFGSILYISNAVKEEGGVKQTIINVGKEIKDISEAINSDSED